MVRRTAHRAWMPLALFALVAQVAFAGASTKLFVCIGDSVARRQCCCADAMGAETAPRHEEVRSRCCCDVVALSVAGMPAAEPARDRLLASSKMLAAIPGSAAVAHAHPRRAVRQAERALAEPHAAIPLLLRKQSLLI